MIQPEAGAKSQRRRWRAAGIGASILIGAVLAGTQPASAQQRNRAAPPAQNAPATAQIKVPEIAEARRICFNTTPEDFARSAAAIDLACSEIIRTQQGEERTSALARRAFARGLLNNLPGQTADWSEVTRLTPTDVRAHTELGTVLERTGDLPGAIRHFSEAIKLAPLSPGAYLNRARIYRRQGDLAAAIADFTAILRAEPRNVDALHGRGVVLYENSQNEDAIRSFTAALAVDPNHMASLTDRAAVFLATGDNAKATDDLKRALAITPTSMDALIRLGKANTNIGNFDAALETCTRAADIDQQDAEPHMCRGGANQRRGDLAASRTDYENALQRARSDRQRLEAFVGRGFANYKQGRHEAAKSDFRKALEIDPKSTEALADLANTEADDGNLDLARQHFAAAIAIDDRDPSPLMRRAAVLAAAGFHQEALDDSEKAVRLAGANYQAYVSRAHTHAWHRDYPRALADLAQADKLSPNSPFVLNLRGRIVTKQGNARGALKDLDAAHALAPNRWEVLRDRGIARYDVKDYDGAVTDLTSALRINAVFAEPHTYLARAYQAQKKTELAISSYKAAIGSLPLDIDGGAAKLAAQQALDEITKPGTGGTPGPVIAAAPPADGRPPVRTAGAEQGQSRFCQLYSDWSGHVYRYTGLNPRRALCN